MQRLILFLFSTLSLPVFIVVSSFNSRLRSTLYERLGFGDWSNFKRENKKLLWIHSASLGEVNGVVPVIKKVKTLFPQIQIIATSTSDTGKAALLKHLNQVLILPFDHPLLMASAFNKIKPDVIAISETEIWPSFILEAKQRNIPVVYFNARISDYTFKNYKRFSGFLKPVLSAVKALYAQTQTDLLRFQELGVSVSQLAGNTKLDLSDFAEIDTKEIRESFGFSSDDLCLVAGSVHPGEDLIVLNVYQKLKQQFRNLKLIIAPRHNFLAAENLLVRQGLNFGKRSECGTADICLLDTIGELSKIYSIADLAFVGGSLVNIGGHNPMEPAAHGVPVVMGQYIATVRDNVEALTKAEAAYVVKNEKELHQVFYSLLSNKEKLTQAGIAAKNVFEQSRGATEKVVEGLKPFLLAQHG